MVNLSVMSARPLIVGADQVAFPYPVYLKGEVVKGFGRGSKELGIPTANLSQDVADKLSHDIGTGIYFGWASVGNTNDRYPMVMSVGWNPFYKNEKKSAEVHIIHEFQSDFYGQEMRVIMLGFTRVEKNYDNLEALIEDINMDIKVALNSLKRSSYLEYKNDKFLSPAKK